MRLKNMLKMYLAFLKPEPQDAYKRYAYKKNMYSPTQCFKVSRKAQKLM